MRRGTVSAHGGGDSRGPGGAPETPTGLGGGDDGSFRPQNRYDSITIVPISLPIVQDLGRISYAEGLARQRAALESVVLTRGTGESAAAQRLFLVEHDPPVITVTRRPSAASHVLAAPARLAALGVELCETDRGGDVTYHGPGQLVVYPILDLNLCGLRIHGYMRLLEEVVIRTLGELGVTGRRDVCATGVWVGDEPITDAPACTSDAAHVADASGPRGGAKICAMGVRVSRWVSMHGLALNVDPEMSHFDLIVPCGLAGRSVTSLRRELGDRCPSMAVVKRAMLRQFESALRACVPSA